jgi:hypothetical protein
MTSVVTRSLGVISLLASLAIAGWLLSLQLKHTGPTSHAASTAISEANQVALAATFRQAEVGLEQSRSLSGTYGGANLNGFGVTLVRADASSFCLQASQGGAVYHDAGPGGTTAAGPC